MFFKIKTVSSILASFTKTLKELEEHAEERARLAADRIEAAAVATKEAAEHSKEAEAAKAVADKIRSLIG